MKKELAKRLAQMLLVLFGVTVLVYGLMDLAPGDPAQRKLTAGGVTVTLEDDFSAADPAMTKGATLTLQGDQAEIFVRRRMDIGEGTNEARMVRQEEYLTQLSAQLESRVQQDQQFTAQVYDALQPYLVTDLAKGRLVNEVWAAKDDTVEPAIALEGEHKVAEDGFTEFYPTEESIQKAVLELFWEPAEE